MIEIISEQLPGSPVKLKKPKELKGVKPLFSVKWGGRIACQVFISGADVYVNHHDWCSISLYGRDNKYKHHYGYNDGFTAPTVRGNAWIKLVGIIAMQPTEALRAISWDTEIDANSRFCCDDTRMFEDIVSKLWKERKNGYGFN